MDADQAMDTSCRGRYGVNGNDWLEDLIPLSASGNPREESAPSIDSAPGRDEHDEPLAATRERERIAVEREGVAAEREQVVSRREALVARREHASERREESLEVREQRQRSRRQAADRREALAEEREHLANQREWTADDREWTADERDLSVGGGRHGPELQAAAREQAEIDREVAAGERERARLEADETQEPEQ